MKNFDSGNPSDRGYPMTLEIKKEFSPEDMDPQAFELYCILMQINEYEKEQNQDKKKLLKTQIQSAIEKYRNPEEVKTGKSR